MVPGRTFLQLFINPAEVLRQWQGLLLLSPFKVDFIVKINMMYIKTVDVMKKKPYSIAIKRNIYLISQRKVQIIDCIFFIYIIPFIFIAILVCNEFVSNLEGDGQVDLIAHFPDVLGPQLSRKANLRIL